MNTRHSSGLPGKSPKPSREAAGFRRDGLPNRILLVDDDPGVRGSLAEVLVGEGYEVALASNGAEALQCFQGPPIGLILLDLNMPGQSGWDLFDPLTSQHPHIPVVIITARPNQLFTALAAGAGALLEKPLDIPQLLHTLRKLLAEPVEINLARLAARGTDFHFAAPQR
jgi:CheY-like chemotaxis protein